MSKGEKHSGAEEVLRIPVSRIAAGKNPRHVDEKSEPFKQLVELVKAHGVQMPVGVRPIGEVPADGLTGLTLMESQGIEYVLLFGERRWRAARAAKLEDLPAIVYRGLSEAEAYEKTFVENIGREDLSAMEQSEAVSLFVASRGGDVQAAAKALGKSETWVLLRMKLKDLSAAWREAIADPESFAFGWGPAHLELVARLDAATQDWLLEGMTVEEEDNYDPNESLARIPAQKLRERLDREIFHSLKGAPWKLDDAKLVKDAGPCDACPKRSSVQPGLFDDGKGTADRCLEPRCWKSKRAAWLVVRVKALKVEHAELMGIRPQSHDDSEEVSVSGIGKGLRSYEYKPAKKGEKGARPAVVLGGAEAGDLKWIKLETYKAKEIAERGKPPKGPSEKQVRAELEQKRWREVEQVLGTAAVDVTFAKLPLAKGKSEAQQVRLMLALMATFGAMTSYRKITDPTKQVAAGVKGATGKKLEELWALVKEALFNDHFGGYSGADLAKRWADFFGLDWRAAYAAALKKMPDPAPKKPEAKKPVKQAAADKARDCEAGCQNCAEEGCPTRKKDCAYRACGCTETNPCKGGCGWVQDMGAKDLALCTACLSGANGKAAQKKAREVLKKDGYKANEIDAMIQGQIDADNDVDGEEKDGGEEEDS